MPITLLDKKTGKAIRYNNIDELRIFVGNKIDEFVRLRGDVSMYVDCIDEVNIHPITKNCLLVYCNSNIKFIK